IVLCLAMCSGCVSTWAVKNEPRDSVRFASGAGAQTFYEAYLGENYTPPEGSGFGVGVRLPYEHRDYLTDNVYFNQAVRAADTNHDELITDEEARAYGQSVQPSKRALMASK